MAVIDSSRYSLRWKLSLETTESNEDPTRVRLTEEVGRLEEWKKNEGSLEEDLLQWRYLQFLSTRRPFLDWASGNRLPSPRGPSRRLSPFFQYVRVEVAFMTTADRSVD